MGGRLGIVHEAAYCAAKFAMCGWSETARIDLAGSGIDVKLVLPGPIDTEIWEPVPGELPGLYDGPFVSAADCAADIVTAIENATASSSTCPRPSRAASEPRRTWSSARPRTSTRSRT